MCRRSMFHLSLESTDIVGRALVVQEKRERERETQTDGETERHRETERASENQNRMCGFFDSKLKLSPLLNRSRPRPRPPSPRTLRRACNEG